MRSSKDIAVQGEPGATPYSFFRVIAQTFGDTPDRLLAILDGTGVAPDNLENERAAFNLDQQIRQIDNLNRIVGSDWVLKAPGLVRATSHDALSIAVLNAPTIKAGLLVIRDALPGRVTRVRTRYSERQDGGLLAIDPGSGLSEDRARPLAEIFLLSTLAMIEAQSPAETEGIGLSFAGAEPAHGPALRALARVQVDYGGGANAIFVPKRYLAVRPPFADLAFHEIARERLEQDARRSRTAEGIRGRVERMLAGSPNGRLGSQVVARSLGLSTRTLTRKLSEGGTDLRKLIDTELASRANNYIISNTFTLAEIGERLGYADPANFSRARRRWRGVAQSDAFGRESFGRK